jgi:glycosyltransferase involved in cell wall biosynthesis
MSGDMGQPALTELGQYTALIAVRPRDPYIRGAVQSILDQTHPPAAIFVVMNGAGGEGPEVPPQIEGMSDLVQVHTIPGTGMVPAINFGLSILTTPFFAFLDSDDLWEPRKQELQLRRLAQDSTLDAVSCTATNFREHPDGTREELMTRSSVMFTCTTFRSESFTTYGIIDPESSHFTWLYHWWSVARSKGIRTEPIEYRGTLRRIHDNNSWVVEGEDAHRELFTELRRLTQARRIVT